MRTTLDIEIDILQAAKELAAAEKSTTGAVLSRLARLGLQAPPLSGRRPQASFRLRNHVPVFPARVGEVVTLEHVEKLMDEEGI